MKYAVIFSSLTGNTKLLADAIKKHFGDDDCSYFGTPINKAIDADIYFVGFWTNKGTCDEVIAKYLKTLNHKKVFIFGTAGFGLDSNYFNSIVDHVKENINDTNKVVGNFMCTGKMQQSVKDRYLANKHSEKPMPNIDLLISAFDEALKHPNKVDLNNLVKSISKMKF